MYTLEGDLLRCTLSLCTTITYPKQDNRYTPPGKTTPGTVYLEQRAVNRRQNALSLYTAPVCKKNGKYTRIRGQNKRIRDGRGSGGLPPGRPWGQRGARGLDSGIAAVFDVCATAQTKDPRLSSDNRGSQKRRLPTLPTGRSVPSAMVSLTSLFGMGRGGSSPL